jgi:hypothetical protein
MMLFNLLVDGLRPNILFTAICFWEVVGLVLGGSIGLGISVPMCSRCVDKLLAVTWFAVTVNSELYDIWVVVLYP